MFTGLLLTSWPADAQTGNDLYKMCGNAFKAGLLHRDACHNFIAGVASGLSAAGTICIPPGSTPKQEVMIVQKYMRDHPDRLSVSEQLVVSDALTEAWHCP